MSQILARSWAPVIAMSFATASISMMTIASMLGLRLDDRETQLLCKLTPEFQCEDELWYRLRAPPVSESGT